MMSAPEDEGSPRGRDVLTAAPEGAARVRTSMYLHQAGLLRKMKAKQVPHHLPFSPPPKRVLLQHCKRCYQVFINSALDKFLQIFSCFTARQATDIHGL